MNIGCEHCLCFNVHCYPKKVTPLAFYNFDVHKSILVILAEMLLREQAIKRSFI